MFTRLEKIIIAKVRRTAKELTDEEVLSLYHSVKEKLNTQDSSEDQVLDGDTSGKEPQSEDTTSLVPPEAPATEAPADAEEAAPADESEVDDSIDDLLESLGLGDSGEEGATEEPATTEAVPVEEKTVEEKEACVEPPKEDMINRVTDKLLDSNPFGVENFKTAQRGMQLNRKDSDLMSDGVKKPKYETPTKNPPRLDARKPFGVRYQKNEKDRDSDIGGDPDLK